MPTVKEIAWVAGILEGEGTFCLNNNSIRFAIAMTDLDVVEKFCAIVDPTKRISPYTDPTGVRKMRYTFTLMGDLSAQWMMTIYPLMGLRRRMKIRELLFHWKNNESILRIVKVLKTTGISEEEAREKAIAMIR